MKRALQTGGQRLYMSWCLELELKHMVFNRKRGCAKGVVSLVSLAGSADRLCISLLLSCELEAELNQLVLLPVSAGGQRTRVSRRAFQPVTVVQAGCCLRDRLVLPSAP